MTAPAGRGRAQRAVIVMAKRPKPGATKTRLSPALSLEQAAALYERFLLDTLACIGARDDCTLLVAIDSIESSDYFAALAPGVDQLTQHGATLGDRLNSVMGEALTRGYGQVFAIGSDSPDLPAEHLTAAFATLGDAETDLVLGPTEDGGYYLIGWKQPWPESVTEVEMSTTSVLSDTVAIAERIGAEVRLAPSWYDVDHPEDLDRLRCSLVADRTSHTARFLAEL